MKRIFSEEHRRKLSEAHKGIQNKNKGSLYKRCPICEKIFHVKDCLINKKFFCSRECYRIEQTKRTPHNKGKPLSENHKNKLRKAHVGKRHSKKTEFKKGQKPHNYKGGKTIKEGGYLMIKKPNHPNIPKFGYIKNSRLQVEKHLNILLPKKYIVHHINHNKSDDNINNLMVFKTNSAHIRFHYSPLKVSPSEIFFDGSKLKTNSC